MHDAFRTACCGAVVVLSLLGEAIAGPLISSNATGMPLWTNSRIVAGIGTQSMSGRIEFSVFAPGASPTSNFQLFLNANGFGVHTDPAASNEYVYVYQVYNTAAATNAFFPGVNIYTVGYEAQSDLTEIGSFSGTGNVNPGNKSIQGNNTQGGSAAWSFVAPKINFNQSSTLLWFTSPNGPRWDSGEMTASNASGEADQPPFGLGVPSPVPAPEPATAALATIGLIVLVAFRRFGRRGA